MPRARAKKKKKTLRGTSGGRAHLRGIVRLQTDHVARVLERGRPTPRRRRRGFARHRANGSDDARALHAVRQSHRHRRSSPWPSRRRPRRVGFERRAEVFDEDDGSTGRVREGGEPSRADGFSSAGDDVHGHVKRSDLWIDRTETRARVSGEYPEVVVSAAKPRDARVRGDDDKNQITRISGGRVEILRTVLDSSSTYAAAVALSKSKSSDSSSARTPPGPRVHGPPAHTSIRPGPPRRRIIAAAVSIATPAHRALPATGPALRPAGLIDEMTASSAARHARAGAMNRPIEPPPSPPPSSSSSSSFPKNASRSAARGDFAPESTSALATALAPPNSYTATDAA
eukprot:31532-Pelagococcus_subviridis.AAC.9